MFTKFKRSSETIFVDPSFRGTIEYDKSKKVKVILSPSIYWVKKLSLPVKYVREVKKLLPSIFEDMLLKGNYSYSAYKSGDDFFVFAYEDKKILSLLEDNGILFSDISSIHFAQSEFVDISRAFKINDLQSIYIKDELLVVAPTSWLSFSSDLDLSTMELSKHTIKLQQYGHIVDNTSLYKIGAILGSLAMLLIVEYFITSTKVSAIAEAKQSIYSKYKLQSTTMQNTSSLKKYKKINSKQTKLREYISYFLKMRLTKEQKITLMDYKNGLLTVSISGVSKSNEKSVLSPLYSKNIQFTKSFRDKNIKVGLKI